MLRSVLVGIDGSAYSAAALELGMRWAQRWDAVLVGLGVVDAATICKAQPVPLGAAAYKIIWLRATLVPEDASLNEWGRAELANHALKLLE